VAVVADCCSSAAGADVLLQQLLPLRTCCCSNLSHVAAEPHCCSATLQPTTTATCTLIHHSVEGQRLPTTGQVAAQQGAYVARLLNRGYVLSEKEPVAPSVARTGPTEWGGLDMVHL
jgi:hypothetical protein